VYDESEIVRGGKGLRLRFCGYTGEECDTRDDTEGAAVAEDNEAVVGVGRTWDCNCMLVKRDSDSVSPELRIAVMVKVLSLEVSEASSSSSRCSGSRESTRVTSV
jgi:hypothetical protein